jgi:hypothetical protein
VQDIFLLILQSKLMRAPDSIVNTLSTGLQNPRTGGVSIFKIFPPKTPSLEPRSGILVWSYDRSCRKSNGQIDSQSTTPRRKISKNSTRNRKFKSKRTGSVGTKQLHIYRMTHKKRQPMGKSRETITLNNRNGL